MASTAETETEAQTFQVGATYEARSAADHECVWTFVVTARTARFVTLREDNGDVMRVGVRLWDGEEWASPFGRYSLSPVIRASSVVEVEPAAPVDQIAFVHAMDAWHRAEGHELCWCGRWVHPDDLYEGTCGAAECLRNDAKDHAGLVP